MAFWTLMLIVVTLGLLLLPLVPALVELIRPTDVTPLRVVQAYDNDPAYFAMGFRNYIIKHFNAGSIGEMKVEKSRPGTLSDGTKYDLIGQDGRIAVDAYKPHGKVMVSAYPLRLPDGGIFDSEIFSRSTITTGENCRMRAMLSEGDMVISKGSTLVRWAHTDGNLKVQPGAVLYGRATAKGTIALDVGVTFERLNAAKIVAGEELAQNAIPQVQRTLMQEIKHVKLRSAKRSLIEGDLKFPAYTTFEGDIVAGSTAIIGDYAHIRGSLKSNAMNDVHYMLSSTGVLGEEAKNSARCELGHYVQIEGSVISTHDLYIGENCRIAGPVIAENLLVIRSGTIIGSPDNPCTVSAPQIIIESGCVVYGSLWAAKQGTVTVARHTQKEVAA